MNYVLHSFFLSELTPEPQSVQLQLKTKARGTEQGKRSAPEKKRENCTLIKVQSYLADTIKLPMYDGLGLAVVLAPRAGGTLGSMGIY